MECSRPSPEKKCDLLLDSWEDIFPSQESQRYLQSHIGSSATVLQERLYNVNSSSSSSNVNLSQYVRRNVIFRLKPTDVDFTKKISLYGRNHRKAIEEDKYEYTDDQQKELMNSLDAKIQNYIKQYKPDRVFIVIETSGSCGSVLAYVARKNKCVTTLINKFDQTKRFAKDVDKERRRYSQELGAYIRQHNLLID